MEERKVGGHTHTHAHTHAHTHTHTHTHHTHHMRAHTHTHTHTHTYIHTHTHTATPHCTLHACIRAMYSACTTVWISDISYIVVYCLHLCMLGCCYCRFTGVQVDWILIVQTCSFPYSSFVTFYLSIVSVNALVQC